jgi:hypothetical protein
MARAIRRGTPLARLALIMRRVVVLLALALVASGCAGEAEAAMADEDLIGGNAAGSRFPATVKLTLPLGAKCGAGKLGARRFLTASHCITHGDVEVGREITISGGAPERQTRANVTRVLFSPFDAAPPGPTAPELSAQAGLDAAIIEIDADTPGVTLARLDRTPLAAGDKVVVSGAGCDSDALSPGGPGRRELKFAVVKIESVEKYHYYLPRTDIDGQESRVCQGDSGTPLYKLDASGKYSTIVGINSFRAPTINLWGAATRLDTNIPRDAERWLTTARVF